MGRLGEKDWENQREGNPITPTLNLTQAISNTIKAVLTPIQTLNEENCANVYFFRLLTNH
jgi:hypothetical protein